MLYPESAEQLQKIILEARNNHTGLVPLSSGAPHFHGASENPQAETVCFSKMNRIMTINRKNRYARVESGVTFGELIPKLAEQGLRMNLPFLARPNKSAAASMLEREAILIPKYQYDYTDPLLTLETVYGTGELFHTGSAAGPGSMEENSSDKILPWGPGTIDYFRFLCGAQGTMGFVTWVTLKAEILPKASRLFFIQAESAEPLIKLANTMVRKRIPDECLILNRENFAAAFADNETEEDRFRGIAPWIMLCRVCGFDRYPEERLAIYDGYVRDAARDAGLCAEDKLSALAGAEERIEGMLTSCDSRAEYWKLRRGAERELLFLAAPSKTAALTEIVEKRHPGIGITVQPQVQGRAFRVECNVRFSGDQKTAAELENSLFDTAKELAASGAYFDRPYGRLTELVYGDAVSVEAMRRLKAIFDPDNILNPGKLCF